MSSVIMSSVIIIFGYNVFGYNVFVETLEYLSFNLIFLVIWLYFLLFFVSRKIDKLVTHNHLPWQNDC